ncbi:hypothetical protein [Sphingorhabdus sp.]|uniref:hypothetical protein n=1 Tax=Sphingorhabdus sp. TaxID=1902408 RepID=UPI003983196A
MLLNDAIPLVPPNLHRLAQSPTHHCAVTFKAGSATDAEVGRPLGPHGLGLGLRLPRPRQPTGFWEMAGHAIKAGDSIIEIVPVASGAPMVSDV